MIPLSYALPEGESSESWLNVNSNLLGRLAEASASRNGFVLEPMAGPLIESTPFQRQDEPIRPKSTARLSGDLAARRAQLPTELPSWPPPVESTSMLVSNTVVELAVDNAGEVVSARLRVKSGIDAADAEALRTAWGLHFSPQPEVADYSGMTWGKLIVQWQTAQETNSPAKEP
jgi:hypothetical protein